MTDTPEWVRNAKVGDKVACVRNDAWCSTNTAPCPLVVGAVYEITGLYPCPDDGVVYVEVADFGDIGFDFVCFRPVSKKSTETGMAILRQIAAFKREPEAV